MIRTTGSIPGSSCASACIPRRRGDPPGAVDLDYSPYTELAELLGTDTRLFGFENGKPLLGETAAGLRNRFPRRIGDGRLKLWPLETGARDLEVLFDSPFETELPETIVGFQLALADTREARKLLEQKFGAPREDAHVLVYRDKPRVALDGDTLLVGEIDPGAL